MANSVFLWPGSLQLGGGLTLNGSLLFAIDNNYNIGSLGALNRPANIYVGQAVYANGFRASGSILAGTYGGFNSPGDGIVTFINGAGNDFIRMNFGGITNAFPAVARSGGNLQFTKADGSGETSVFLAGIFASEFVSSTPERLTAGSGLGITALSNGHFKRAFYKVTVTKDAFITAGLTAEVTIGTLPAKTRVLGIVADTTVAYAGLAGTITLMLGYGATPNEFVIAHDVKTAAVTKGLADADLGAGLARATAVLGGVLPSWSATTAIKARITSSVGNVGDGAATLMSAGSTTYYIVTERMV